MSIKQGISTDNETAEDRIYQGTMSPKVCQEFRLQVGGIIEKARKVWEWVILQKALSTRSKILINHGKPLKILEKRGGMLRAMY